MINPATIHDAGVRTIQWLEQLIVTDARGDHDDASDVAPTGRYWLGRLAPEITATEQTSERGERMDPCACGVRFRPSTDPPWTLDIVVSFRVWVKAGRGKPWHKSPPIIARLRPVIDGTKSAEEIGRDELSTAIGLVEGANHLARVEVEVEDDGGPVIAVTLVNESPAETPGDSAELVLYEAWLEVDAGPLRPFVLDALPDSFRYDRNVLAYGINGGVAIEGTKLRTVDVIHTERPRPRYWDDSIGAEPDLSFERLANDPLPPLEELVAAAHRWGERHWSHEALEHRAAEEGWETVMLEQALSEGKAYGHEVERMRRGVEALVADHDLQRAFRLMNDAMKRSARGRYPGWRPFQVGFQLAVLPSLAEPNGIERKTVDTLWFATGGGKTETYLGVVVTTCLYDRIRGKQAGVTAWSRFPLRMLSLQQMQRFADALAGAEMARRQHDLGGAPFRLGFLVGAAGTPNRIREDPDQYAEDADDPDMPGRYKRLERCPFCDNRDLEMAFDKRHWTLVHRCTNDGCPWPDEVLPVHVVDEEVFRFLPSVVVGTLDKAATIAWQAAMRGLVASPLARCTGPMHGYRYAKRSTNADGCLVPGCRYSPEPLGQERALFAPSVRVQDELHLLRDSLGAVDAQYETLLDHLSAIDGPPPAKIIASSATLAGHDEQVWTLYRRVGRVFPMPGPRPGHSFWSQSDDRVLRRFVGFAPRGQTLEYASDRISSVLQREIRRLNNPTQRPAAASEINVSEDQLDDLLSLYGTQVVYGSRLRDVEAAARSFGSEIPVAPLDFVTLTGATPFDDVRTALERLGSPEPDFDDRIHLVAASSMMSHGVDIDRLNIITMLGLPLTTAEFIQTTARIGRTHPGLVVVLHRMGGERDASVFRSFPVWVEHGDRFVEAVPITRRSRRVLQLAYPGAFVARVYDVHEPRALAWNGKNLAKATRVGRYFGEMNIGIEDEYIALLEALAIDPTIDPELAADLRRLVIQTFRLLEEPGDRTTIEICGERPMTSLRDVEAQAPIVEYVPGRRRRS
jgi:hypothetical protein